MKHTPTGRIARWVAYAGAGVLIVRAAEGWLRYRLILRPDTALYVQNAHWWYPSPIGRLIGAAGGVELLGWANFAAAIAVAVLAAGWYGWRMTWCLVVAPASLYLDVAGVDTLAVLLVLVALHRRSRAIALLPLVVHPAAAVYSLPLVLRRASTAVKWAAVGLVVPVVVGAALSPYVGIVTRLGFSPLGFVAGIAAVALPVGLLGSVGSGFRRRWRSDLLLGVFVSLPAALEAAVEHHVQVRYGLPALVVGVPLVAHVNELLARDPARARERAARMIEATA